MDNDRDDGSAVVSESVILERKCTEGDCVLGRLARASSLLCTEISIINKIRTSQ